jgi:parallel beta-helix repeat protein
MERRPEAIKVKILILALVVSGLFNCIHSQSFQHPGIDQSAADLTRMKQWVLEGKQPYKDAFLKLKGEVEKPFAVISHTRVMRGPYGKPNIGGEDLRASANMAYNNALLWYISGEKKYANKAIEIINAWTPILWDFDFNDAKLIAALTGSVWCNAAEILNHTPSGWEAQDVSAFRKMLMTVYYPLLRFYFPTANGNWNGGIIQTLLAISIFMDDRNMFNNAIDNFLHSPANGSLFKYIYPNGQCQESPRDQGHVQMGLGLFAGAAQIAFTQGVDFFTLGDNRIAKGFEFTGSYMLGKDPHCYCTLSPALRDKLRDDYEYVYQHYRSIGVPVPWTKRVADSIRPNSARPVLSSVRAIETLQKSSMVAARTNMLFGLKNIAGADASTSLGVTSNVIIVQPGQSIQEVLNGVGNEHRIVLLVAGVHRIKETLKIPSNTTLTGEGNKTKLFLDPASGMRDVMVNADSTMHDVTIRNMIIEVSDRLEVPSDPNSHRSRGGGYNRGGILFHAMREGQMKNITLLNLTVRNATFNGVFISGADNVNILGCDFDENGGNAIPGQKLQHNLLLTHCKNIVVKDSRLTTSPFGAGLALDQCNNAALVDNEIARNGYYGILIAESQQVEVKGNLIEANDRSGILMEYFFYGNRMMNIHDNMIQFNAGWGIESYASVGIKTDRNEMQLNGNNKEQIRISAEKKILMQ